MNNKIDNIPLYETEIYKKLRDWSGDFNRSTLKTLKECIERAEGDYRKELQKIYRKTDFVRTFIIMCELARQIFVEEKDKEAPKDFIMNVVGSVIGDIILETNNIKRLNEIMRDLDGRHHKELTRCVHDRKEGRVWILDHTSIREDIENVLSENQKEKEMERVPVNWEMTFGDCVKYNFALFSGVSLTEVESMLARGISRTYLHNILYGFIMRRLLTDGLNDDLYITGYWDRDLFNGRSGVNLFLMA